MGKEKKSSTSSSSTLGWALGRHHLLRWKLESVTDRLFPLLNTSSPDIPFDMDGSKLTPEEMGEQQKEEVLHAISLRVPRRHVMPPWNASMTGTTRR